MKDLPNVAIHHGDARDVLDALADASLDKAYLLFPGPLAQAAAQQAPLRQPEKPRPARPHPGNPARFFCVASDILDYVRWTLVEIAAFNRAHGETFIWQARKPEDWRIRPADVGPARATRPRHWWPGGCRRIWSSAGLTGGGLERCPFRRI